MPNVTRTLPKYNKVYSSTRSTICNGGGHPPGNLFSLNRYLQFVPCVRQSSSTQSCCELQKPANSLLVSGSISITSVTERSAVGLRRNHRYSFIRRSSRGSIAPSGTTG